MTLEEINELVDEIQQLLMSESDPSEEELIDLAGRHEDLVSEAAKRLKAVDSLLSRGLRSEAIELAEREPNLNEVVIALDFPELDAWNELLAGSEMQPVAALPTDIAAELNDAYGRSAPVEKLLQRHRCAALSRAPLAYRIDVMRRLCAADPENPVWPKDVKHFEQQRLSEIKDDLELAIREQDILRLAALDQELASPDWRNKVPAELQRKVADAHAKVRRAEARAEMDEIAFQLSDAYGEFDILTAKRLGQRFEALAQIVRLSPNDALLNVAGPALDWLREEQTKEDQEQRFQAQLNAIETALNRKTTIEELERIYYGVTQHGHSIPERLENRLADRLETLRVEGNRKRRLTVVAVAAAAIVSLAATGLFIRYISVRNAIGRHQTQLKLLLPEAEKTGLIQPLDEYFHLLEDEPASVSRSAELVGLRKQFETLKLSEAARVAQIDQQVTEAIAAKNNIATPSGFSRVLALLNEASLLAKNTSEKNIILLAENEVRKRKSEVQLLFDEEFTIKLRDVTAAVAALPVDSTPEYDGMLVRLSELQKTEHVSDALMATVEALQSKVVSQRLEVSTRIEVAKGLQLITDSVGQVNAFATQLQKYVETHAGSSRTADLQKVLESEKNLWNGAIQWNDIRSRILAVDVTSLSPSAAKKLVDDIAVFQKSSGPYCGETLLNNRLKVLQSVAKRRIGSDGTFLEQFRPVFDGKVITASFLVETSTKKERYFADAAPLIEKNMIFDCFTTPSGDQTIAKELSLSLFPDARQKKRDDWLSPQSRMSQSIFKELGAAKVLDFEETVTEITTKVLTEPDIDPILRFLLAEQLLKTGADGSHYIATGVEKILDEIANAGIPRLTNWVDFQDRETKKQRDNATAFLEQSSNRIIEALKAAEMNRGDWRTTEIGPAVRWVGWLYRNDRSGWSILTKGNVASDVGERVCVFRKTTPTATPDMLDIGRVSPEGNITVFEQINTTSPVEGRPVFQILDSE